MKVVLGLILGVILGFLLGGLGPRSELAAANASLAQTQADLADAQKRASRGHGLVPLPGLEQLDGERESAASSKTDDGGHHRGRRRWDRSPSNTGHGSGEGGASGDDATPQTPEQMKQELNAAVEAQRVRAKQSRAALQEQADLSDENMAEFDRIVDDMNGALSAYAEDTAAWAQQDPDTKDALGVAHEVSGILYESQTALEQLVGSANLSNVDEPSRQVWNYVDLQPFADALAAQGVDLQTDDGGSDGSSGAEVSKPHLSAGAKTGTSVHIGGN